MEAAGQGTSHAGASRLAIAGMVLLVVVMVGVMFVITDTLFGSVAAVATAAGSGFFFYV